jgi:hypothetical protein
MTTYRTQNEATRAARRQAYIPRVVALAIRGDDDLAAYMPAEVVEAARDAAETRLASECWA